MVYAPKQAMWIGPSLWRASRRWPKCLARQGQNISNITGVQTVLFSTKGGGEVIWTKSKRTAFFFGKLSHRVTHRQTPHEYSQYPWLANLGYNSVRRLNITYNCAGSLIGDRFLTNLSVIGDGNKWMAIKLWSWNVWKGDSLAGKSHLLCQVGADCSTLFNRPSWWVCHPLQFMSSPLHWRNLSVLSPH